MNIREHLRLSLRDVQRTLQLGQDVFQNSTLMGPTSIHFAAFFFFFCFFSKVRLLFCFVFVCSCYVSN